jgi:hypothetical protein
MKVTWKSISLCFLLSVLFLTAKSWAATYYVDATNGDDSNPGTSEPEPWKTIAKVNNSNFQPGDFILFKRGETWREQLTVPSSGSEGNPITFGGYGSGDKPIINGADLVVGWKQHDTNIWKSSVSAKPEVIVLDGKVGNKKNSQENVDSLYDWYWISNYAYIYSVSDPDTAYTNPGIEATQTRGGAEHGCPIDYNGKDYITIENIHVKYADDFAIIVVHANNAIIQDCEIDTPRRSGIQVGGSDNVLIKRCSMHDSIQGHGVYLDGLEANGTDNPIVEYCNIYGNEYQGIQLNGNNAYRVTNPIVRYNLLHDNKSHGINDLSSNDGKYYYNVIYGNGRYGIAHAYDDSQDPDGNFSSINAVDYNNTICADIGWRGIYVSGKSTGHMIKNNILYWSTTNVHSSNLIHVSTDGDASLDYNCYYATTNGGFHLKGTDYNSFSVWQSSTEQDNHSIDSNPLFINPSVSDFRLQSTSPSINAGISVDLTRDFEGTPVPQGNGVDIGAYEYSKISPPNNLHIVLFK